MIEQTIPEAPAFSARRIVVGASSALLAFERLALMGLMYLLTALILVNVVTRYSHFPIYWIDESAVYCVVWLTFVGASAMTRLRLDFAVTMMTERLSARNQKMAKVIATGMVVVFGMSLIATCVLWMDPIGLVRAGFDARKLAAETFNFLYTERTQTLNWPTWVRLPDAADLCSVDDHSWPRKPAGGSRAGPAHAAEGLSALRARRGQLSDHLGCLCRDHAGRCADRALSLPCRPRLHRRVRQSRPVPILSAATVRRCRQLWPDRHSALHPDRRDHEWRRHYPAHRRYGHGLCRLAERWPRLRQHPRQHVHLLHSRLGDRAGCDHGADHGPRNGEEGLRQDVCGGTDRLWRHARADHSAIGDVRGLQRARAGFRQRHADRRHRAGRDPHRDVLRRHRPDGLRLQLPQGGLPDAAAARDDDPAHARRPC